MIPFHTARSRTPSPELQMGFDQVESLIRFFPLHIPALILCIVFDASANQIRYSRLFPLLSTRSQSTSSGFVLKVYKVCYWTVLFFFGLKLFFAALYRIRLVILFHFPNILFLIILLMLP